MAIEVKLYSVKEKICAWEISDEKNKKFYNGGARPFKNTNSMNNVLPSDYYGIPYTKKQLKTFDYIGKFSSYFEDIFSEADEIIPVERYDNVIKNTFGPRSRVYQLYHEKAQDVKDSRPKPDLYIDFEAMNMRLCGWYGELVNSDGTVEEVYEGVAKPFSDKRYVRRLWTNTYGELLPYSLDELYEARHIRSYERYFTNMFVKARKIYTYGDTDALFVKSTFGVDLYNFFRIKNVDCSLRVGTRVVSLEKTSHLFQIELEGTAHNPKYDVKRMQEYLRRADAL